MTSEAMTMIQGIPRKSLQDAATELDKTLLAHGCLAYVKTIYIGYELDGEMIAAVYPRADHLEVALAIPEDQEHDLLRDASHLTWRTLPLAAVVASKRDVVDIGHLLVMACSRVSDGVHDVHRDNDFFVRSARERRRRGEK